MGNHTVDCEYCKEDMRGLSGVGGCFRQRDANNCSEYHKRMTNLAKLESEKLRETNNEVK